MFQKCAASGGKILGIIQATGTPSRMIIMPLCKWLIYNRVVPNFGDANTDIEVLDLQAQFLTTLFNDPSINTPPQPLRAKKTGHDLQRTSWRNQRRLMAQRRFADLEPLAAKILR